jgi:Ca-activated chloride channel family protein
VAEIAFALDEQPILAKRSPPWSVELDLGSLPRARVLRATARDDDGTLLAADELVLNSGADRFAVSIASPLPGQHFAESVRLVAAVELPAERTLDRLELYRDETLVATLYQPPWEQPMLLPRGSEVAYLRAVAYSADGDVSEDAVFVNAPPGLEEIDVQLVELYTSVVDRQGRLVTDLAVADVAVLEDGAPQQPVRFERVGNLPIKVALLLDVSASMEERLEEARRAALAFCEDILTSKDRAALITFNDRPHLQVELTAELERLGGSLAGLKAERGTSLYDSVVFALYYLNGVGGQRALVVLSDGDDESSRFTFAETLEFAQRAGIAVYTIGLGLDGDVREARKALQTLARDTGGRSYFVASAGELGPIYRAIEEELRAQYLIVYQSTNSGGGRKFRRVEVKLRERGLVAKTIRGYYP